MTSLEHIGDTDDGLVALTPKMDGVTDQWWRPVNGTTQPGMDAEGKCHVQERLATNKVSSSFLPNFSPVIAHQYLFIFVKLEEDNICLFYNFPFGQTHPYVLTSLVTVKLTLVCMDKFVAIVLTSLTTKKTWSFSILENLKRDGKETPVILFRHIIP